VLSRRDPFSMPYLGSFVEERETHHERIKQADGSGEEHDDPNRKQHGARRLDRAGEGSKGQEIGECPIDSKREEDGRAIGPLFPRICGADFRTSSV